MDATNPGYEYRGKLIAESKIVKMCGYIYDDMFEIDKYILPGIEVRLKFIRSAKVFNILSTNEGKSYKSVIESAVFYCRKHVLSQEVRNMHLSSLQHEKAIYPFVQSTIKTFLILKSAQSCVCDSLFATSFLPHRIIIGPVKTAAFNGQYSLSPFNFENFKLSTLNVTVNSDASMYKSQNLEIINSNNLLALQLLKKGLVSGFDFDRSNYDQGCNFFFFESAASHAVSEGTVKIDMNFQTALSDPVTVVIFAQFDKQISIDRDYVVSLD